MRYHHALCYGCGADAVNGLHVRVIAGEGATSTATMTVPQWMEGGPGVIHGGLLSAAFDEVMGTTALLIGVPVVTGHLEIDLPSPSRSARRCGSPVKFLGRVGRKIYMRSEAFIVDADGEAAADAKPVARSLALFIGIDPRKHFSAHVANSQRPDAWTKYSSP